MFCVTWYLLLAFKLQFSFQKLTLRETNGSGEQLQEKVIKNSLYNILNYV